MPTRDELRTILELHRLWMTGLNGGSRADLRGADLRGANLRGANLQGAVLRGAKFFPNWVINSYRDLLWVGPLGSRNDWLMVNVPTLRVVAGCFEGPIEAFEAAVEKSHGDNEYGREYKATITYLKALATARVVPEEVQA